ncbi:hypothetical protein BT96DRAFT_948185 [Gymnopus androsaceus JB14]|uniref:Uncharacterized protein n=1 Tax=Gymnopus androsaceus JB14 TaxID=1447944 RepID=A0A6A4GQK7_9AGAR|nr:hypothetical protein BT96DRAFT_948185 [Gymnopus androsaceus JB14]
MQEGRDWFKIKIWGLHHEKGVEPLTYDYCDCCCQKRQFLQISLPVPAGKRRQCLSREVQKWKEKGLEITLFDGGGSLEDVTVKALTRDYIWTLVHHQTSDLSLLKKRDSRTMRERRKMTTLSAFKDAFCVVKPILDCKELRTQLLLQYYWSRVCGHFYWANSEFDLIRRCCTVNFPQGWPKFISNAFLTTADGKGLVQLYLGPFNVQTTLDGDNLVKKKPFTYHFRVPSWLQGGFISFNEGEKIELVPDEETGLMPVMMSFYNEAEPGEFSSESPVHALPSPIFDSGKPPVSIEVSACLIDWPLAGDMFATSPPESPKCLGEERTIKLVPFGATRLRISEFPAFTESSLFNSGVGEFGQKPFSLRFTDNTKKRKGGGGGEGRRYRQEVTKEGWLEKGNDVNRKWYREGKMTAI